jgi:hypothetical protein
MVALHREKKFEDVFTNVLGNQLTPEELHSFGVDIKNYAEFRNEQNEYPMNVLKRLSD